MSGGEQAQFGVNGVQQRRDWPCLTLDESRSVLRFFHNMPPAQSVAWHSMRPFSALGRVRLEGQGECLLKRHHVTLRSVKWLEEEHAFINHLAGEGAAVCPPLVLPDGHTALTVGDWTYEAFLPARGVDVYQSVMSWQPYFSVRQAYGAGVALGRLHLAAAGFKAPARGGAEVVPLLSGLQVVGQPELVPALQHWVARQPQLRSALAHRNWVGDVEAVLLPFQQRLQPLLPHIVTAWGHGDWHGSNLFWNGDDVSCVLDFGMADRTCASFDLAVALERAVVDWLALPAAGVVAWEQVAALLEGYQSVRPLSAGECAQVVAFLPLVHVEFALSEVGYFAGLVHDQASAEVAYMDYLLGHGRWFACGEGKELLARLPALLRQTASQQGAE
ncbi:phosphotransferase enzyme family protein [Acetobacter fabarum]|uniref:phosphotransferase enzyme family protein n=1 Tax=Acetobacter fabarum TaxID=483199 RepID=UPI0033BD7D5C